MQDHADIAQQVDSRRRFVKQLADGDNIEEVYLVVDKQLRANRNGNLYLQLELRDRTGSISARLWNAGEPLFRSFEAGDFLLVKGKVQLFQGALQMILSHIDRVPGREGRTRRLPAPHRAGRQQAVRTAARAPAVKLNNPHLRALAECFLMDEEFVRALLPGPGRHPQPSRLPRRPAGTRRHPARRGRPHRCRSTPSWTATCS